jgi:hypothetical protein
MLSSRFFSLEDVSSLRLFLGEITLPIPRVFTKLSKVYKSIFLSQLILSIKWIIKLKDLIYLYLTR